MKRILVSAVALGTLIVGLAGPASAGVALLNGASLNGVVLGNGVALPNGADRGGLSLDGVILPDAAK
jgi:hypothetical protein